MTYVGLSSLQMNTTDISEYTSEKKLNITIGKSLEKKTYQESEIC
jgi:hypothetical protein